MKLKFLSLFITISTFFLQTSITAPLAEWENDYLNDSATIDIHFDRAYQGDTIIVQYWPTPLAAEFGSVVDDGLPKREFEAVLDEKGNAQAIIRQIQGYGYISLLKEYVITNIKRFASPLLNFYLLRAGDNIAIDVQTPTRYPSLLGRNPGKYDLVFSGKGSEKFSCLYQTLIELSRRGYQSGHGGPVLDSDGLFNPVNSETKEYATSLQLLDTFKARLSTEEYERCKAEVLGAYLYNLGNLLIVRGSMKTQLMRNITRPFLTRLIDSLSKKVRPGIKAGSLRLADGILKLETAGYYLGGAHVHSDSLYYELKEKYAGEFRERILTEFFLKEHFYLEQSLKISQDCLSIITYPAYRSKVKELSIAFKGMPFDDFSMVDQTGKTVSLSDFKDKIVVMDFYFYGCVPCRRFYGEVLRFVEMQFKENKDIVFLAIDVDDNIGLWKKGLATGFYTSMDQANVVNIYSEGFEHPILKKYFISGFPTIVVLDKKHRIVNFNSIELRDKAPLVSIISRCVDTNL